MRGFLVVCIAVAAACSATGSGTSPVRSPPASGVPSIGASGAQGDPSGAERCRRTDDVETALRQFASAFNSGNEATIRSMLSTEFWALSLVVEGGHEVAYGREDAVRYVLARQNAGDRLDFIRVQVNELAGWDGAAQIGPVTFELRRRDATFELRGKGALYCVGAMQGIKVLVLGE